MFFVYLELGAWFFSCTLSLVPCAFSISCIMPRILKWTGLLAAVLLIASCFLPWVNIESRNLVLTAVDTTGTNYGKPGYFHFVMAGLFVVFTLIPRLWAKRANLPVVALNIAWALRNFFIIAACQGGECPVKMIGLWLVVLASVLMLLSALFPDMKLKKS